MSYTEDVKALQTVSVELEKIKARFEKKAAKEREKIKSPWLKPWECQLIQIPAICNHVFIFFFFVFRNHIDYVF